MAAADPVLSKDLIALWEECIWHEPEIRKFTLKVHPCDITQALDSTCDLEEAYCGGEVNFIQYFIQRFRRDDQVGCCGNYRYRVRIEYYREDSCDNQNKIQEFFEVLDDLIEENLGRTWKDCVDNSERDNAWPDIRRFGTIENRVVYVGSFTYFAEAQPSTC